jgi:hypothetical protein
MVDYKSVGLAPSEPDSVTLNFQPDGKEFGRLCSSRGPEFIIASSSPWKTPFQYTIRRSTEVHGYGTFQHETVPTSFLLFDVALRTEDLSRSRRIKKVKIEMEFRSMDSQGNDSAVRVIEVAPGDPTAWFSYSTEKVDEEHDLGGSAGLKIFCGNATGSWTTKRTKSKERHFWASIEASSMPSDESETANYVKWVFKENTSQQSAVPTDVTLAVLLTRGEAGFVCKTKVELEVDWVTKVMYTFADFNLWRAQTELSFFKVGSSVGGVENRSNGIHKLPAIDEEHLEKMIDDKEGLRKFVDIYMPEI